MMYAHVLYRISEDTKLRSQETEPADGSHCRKLWPVTEVKETDLYLELTPESGDVIVLSPADFHRVWIMSESGQTLYTFDSPSQKLATYAGKPVEEHGFAGQPVSRA